MVVKAFETVLEYKAFFYAHLNFWISRCSGSLDVRTQQGDKYDSGRIELADDNARKATLLRCSISFTRWGRRVGALSTRFLQEWVKSRIYWLACS